MAPYYKFAVIRLAPRNFRGESINIGALILNNDGLDIRLTKNLDRIKAISLALQKGVVFEIIENMRSIDKAALANGDTDPDFRLSNLAQFNPLELSDSGEFTADHNSYEARVAAILQRLVEPEPAPKIRIEKKTRLFTEIKKALRLEGVLASRDEGLDSHRIVTSYEVGEGLVADMVLRNGAYHVVETVDAAGPEAALRRAVSEIALSALVMECARMRFGASATRGQVVYCASHALEKLAKPSLDAVAHQGAELVNWASTADRSNFIQSISSLAVPVRQNRKRRYVMRADGDLFH